MRFEFSCLLFDDKTALLVMLNSNISCIFLTGLTLPPCYTQCKTKLLCGHKVFGWDIIFFCIVKCLCLHFSYVLSISYIIFSVSLGLLPSSPLSGGRAAKSYWNPEKMKPSEQCRASHQKDYSILLYKVMALLICLFVFFFFLSFFPETLINTYLQCICDTVQFPLPFSDYPFVR